MANNFTDNKVEQPIDDGAGDAIEVRAAFHDALHDALQGNPHGGGLLQDWVARYPQHERELVEVAVQQKYFGGLPDGTPLLGTSMPQFGADAPDFAKIHEKFIRNAQSRAKTLPIKSINSELRARGGSLNELASDLRISKTILTKLDKRMLAPGSLPNHFIEALAKAIGRSLADMKAYLTMPPSRPSTALSFKATEAPGVSSEQQDFRRALETDEDVKGADRAHWLSQIDPASAARED